MIHMHHRNEEWPWWVRCYYATDVEPPKQPGMLAIATKHRDEASRNKEIEAGHARKDIGRVEWGSRG